MKKGQIIEGTVERIDFPNKGIVVTEEGSCTVKNALPGQKIKAVIQKNRKGRAEGRLLSVEENSPLETSRICPHFGTCGGCMYMSLPYEEEVKIKEGQIRKLLTGVLDRQERPWIFEGIKKSPECYGYRNKMEFSFGDEVKDGPLALGMHKRGSFYDIVTVDHCQIVDEDYRKILSFTRDYFAERNVSFFHRLRHTGYLRHLLMRKAKRTGEILAALVTTSQEEVDLTAYKKGLLALSLDGSLTGILHITNDAVADVVQSDRTEILYGRDFFEEELLGLRFKISVFSFFQTNSLSAEVLYQTVRDYVGDLTDGEGKADKVVYDLYSGTGTIAQLLSPVAKKVIGVEIVEEAVEAARENAKRNGLTNCEFIAGDVLKVLDQIKEKPDMIVLDPPRDGIHPKALTKIISYGIDRIVYISCKPTSLVRDLEVFLEEGYYVEKAVAVDQFPFTTGIETVCLLSKLNVKHHIEVEITMDELDLTAAESKATYDEIKAYVLEKFGFKVSQLYIAQIKRKCGIIERKNYNQSKKEDAKVPKCPPEKEAAIMDALKHFQMIP